MQARVSLLLLCLFGNSHFLHCPPPHADSCSSHGEHTKHTQQDEASREPQVGFCQRKERLVTGLSLLSRPWLLAWFLQASGMCLGAESKQKRRLLPVKGKNHQSWDTVDP